MKTIYIIIITVVCTLVGTFGALGIATMMMFQEFYENDKIYDEMYNECREKYFDQTKEYRDQGKEFRDCIDRIPELMDER